jgi:hypothetical protein
MTTKSTNAAARKSAARKSEPRAINPTPVVDSSSEPVEVSPVSAWKKNTNAPLTLPSGKVMLIRNVGFKAFIKAGIIPNSLMSTVESSLATGKTPDLSDLENKDENLSDMFDLVDEVTIFCAIDPKVHRAPKDEADRSNDLLYVDEVEDEDKMFIFGTTTGGTRDVEQFRREQADSMVALQRGE